MTKDTMVEIVDSGVFGRIENSRLNYQCAYLDRVWAARVHDS